MRDVIRQLAQFSAWRLRNLALAYETRVAVDKTKNSLIVGAKSVVEYKNIVLKPGAILEIGDASMVVGNCIFDRDGGRVTVGARTYVNGTLNCAKFISIGDDVLISSGGYISDHNSHALRFEHRSNDVIDYLEGRKDWEQVAVAPVKIESKAWIGYGVIVLKGVTIGEGAVVGAGSVVTKSIPPYSIAVGNPARPVRDVRG
jgi:acetyltransferase-like isoleucine patch superfamily enzyme